MSQVNIDKFHTDNFIFKKLPILLYVGRIDNDFAWHFPKHKHSDYCEIIYIREGKGEFIISGKHYPVKKGDIVVYNKDILHEENSDSSEPLKTYYCGVENVYLQGIEEGCIIPSNSLPVINTYNHSFKIENYFSNMFEEYRYQKTCYEIICQSLLMSIIALIFRILYENNVILSNEKAPNLSVKIKDYIDRNYTKNITLKDIADTFYISKYYLCHIFKKEVGESPIDYLITRRIEEAQKLLLTTNYTIQTISQLTGYDNSNYFSIAFKKKTGLTPSEYRNTFKIK